MTLYECGNQGYVNTSAAYEEGWLYNCGLIQGAIYGNSSVIDSNRRNSTSNAGTIKSTNSWLTCLIIFLFQYVAVHAYHETSQIDVVPMPNATVDAFLVNQFENGTRYMLAESTLVYAVDVNPYVGKNSTVYKRDYRFGDRAGVGIATWKQAKKARSGVWWTGWVPATGCMYTGLGADASISRQVCDTEGWSVTTGGGVDFAGLSAMAEYTISREHQQCTSWTCNTPSDTVLRMYSQHKMYWADIQTQDCEAITVGVDVRITCHAYGAYIRYNAPISDNHNDNINIGCSIGRDANC